MFVLIKEHAARVMTERPPDMVIGEKYLRRWYDIPRNRFFNIYLHEFLGSDDDRACHDHPWPSISIVLHGYYKEYFPDGTYLIRREGDIIFRTPKQLHRIELVGNRAITMFITGPRIRNWGFLCPQGWIRWQDFCYMEEGKSLSRGCGEIDDD